MIMMMGLGSWSTDSKSVVEFWGLMIGHMPKKELREYFVNKYLSEITSKLRVVVYAMFKLNYELSDHANLVSSPPIVIIMISDDDVNNIYDRSQQPS